MRDSDDTGRRVEPGSWVARAAVKVVVRVAVLAAIVAAVWGVIYYAGR